MKDAVERYLTTQLIAYIGNKRRLLPALGRLFRRLADEHPVRVMLDPFAGSGAVSRLGRAMGFQVLANDWEEYSRVINRTHLCLSPESAEALFRERGGLPAVLARINTLDGPVAAPYFSRFYAPVSTEKADYRRERLFYTRENALFLDRARGWIEKEYPPGVDPASVAGREKDLLVAMLLYEAATHANTSGVFKAFHKGFGGHGKDALGRIMSPMELEYPVLIDGPDAEVGCGEAADFSRGRSCDLCYLDPPYTIHQYGSNYHILNTLARWDRPEASLELGEDGRLLQKAGIRRDWIATRSSYCRRAEAAGALEELLRTIDARRIVLSYNSEGLIPMEELTDIMSRTGRLEILSEEYTQYRGGEAGNAPPEHDHRIPARPDPGERSPGQRFRADAQFSAAQGAEKPSEGHVPSRTARGPRSGSRTEPSILNRAAEPLFLCRRSGAVIPGLWMHSTWSFSMRRNSRGLKEELHGVVFRNNGEEAGVLLDLMAQIPDGGIRREMRERFFLLLRKLAHKKYRDFFWDMHAKGLDEFRPLPMGGKGGREEAG